MFENMRDVQVADPAVLADVVLRLSDEDIADLPAEEAEAVVVATQRAISAMAARQRSAMETVVRRCEERIEAEAADAAPSH